MRGTFKANGTRMPDHICLLVRFELRRVAAALDHLVWQPALAAAQAESQAAGCRAAWRGGYACRGTPCIFIDPS